MLAKLGEADTVSRSGDPERMAAGILMDNSDMDCEALGLLTTLWEGAAVESRNEDASSLWAWLSGDVAIHDSLVRCNREYHKLKRGNNPFEVELVIILTCLQT